MFPAWRSPGEGIIKINRDAACRAGMVVGGIGVVARDGYGEFLAVLGRHTL